MTEKDSGIVTHFAQIYPGKGSRIDSELVQPVWPTSTKMMRHRRTTVTTTSTGTEVLNGSGDSTKNRAFDSTMIGGKSIGQRSLLFSTLQRLQSNRSQNSKATGAVLLLLIMLLLYVFFSHYNRRFIDKKETAGLINNRKLHPPSKVREDASTHFFEPIPPQAADADADAQGYTYDVYNCPEIPPMNYPREYPILDLLNNWNPSKVKSDEFPKFIYQGICVFDFQSRHHRETADKDKIDETLIRRIIRRQVENYRNAEVPFIIRNDPDVMKSVELWTKDDSMSYLKSRLHGKKFQATLSNSTVMTYFSLNPDYNIIPKDFVPSTRNVPMTYNDWLSKAIAVSDSRRGDDGATSYPEKYAYLRLDACIPNQKCDSTYLGNPELDNADFIYSDMDFLLPKSSSKWAAVSHDVNDDLYKINRTQSRGIQCRLGVPGLIAEAHFDNENNYIVMMGGSRRYLLGRPKNCQNMYLYDQKHPLERHTSINWSTPVETIAEKFPNFHLTTMNEVVLQPGDVLYLPTYWFHHIISLTINYQCNTRNGYDVKYDQTIYDCGFFYDFPIY